MPRRILLFILLLLLFRNVNAQQQDLWTTFSSIDGLADNRVEKIVESSDGILWLVTAKGLNYFQDLQWHLMTTENGLSSNNVIDVFEASDGTMWFFTDSGIDHLLQNERMENFRYNLNLIGTQISAIFLGRDDTFWIFGNTGVALFRNNQWSAFQIQFGTMSNSITAVAEASDGSMWFGASNGICGHFKDNVWTYYPVSPNGMVIKEIIETSDGTIWTGSWGDGVHYFKNGQWRNINDSGLITGFIYSIFEASDQSLWFGGIGGVSRLKYNQWSSYSTQDGLTDINVLDIIEARDGSIWFATMGGGVSRLEFAIWQKITFETDEGLKHFYMSDLVQAFDGSLWFATQEGAYQLKDNELLYFSDWDGLQDNYLLDIFQSSDGSIWFGSRFGSTRLLNGEWSYYDENDGLVSDWVNTMIETDDGAFWFGTSDGVSRLFNETWTNYTLKNGLLQKNVQAVYGADDGSMWFGTEGGVSRLKDGFWSTYTKATGLAGNNVTCITQSLDGAMWFGTGGDGLSRFRDNSWKTFTVDDGLAYNDINTIFLASDSALWFGTQDGGASRYKNGDWITFTSSDGLTDNDINSIIEGYDGSIWFGTQQGGACKFRPDQVPPATRLTTVPDSVLGIRAPLLAYTGFDYRTAESKLVYKVTIISDDANYTHSELVSTMFYQTPALENGRYICQVQALDEWRNMDPTPATCRFIIDATPPTVVFNAPHQNQYLKSQVPVLGSAFDNSPLQDFKYYQLYYRPYSEEMVQPEWKQDAFSGLKAAEVKSDTLGIFDTTLLEDGPFHLKLGAEDWLEHTAEDMILVFIDNTRPEVKIQSPSENAAMRTSVNIQASIVDKNLEQYQLSYRMENSPDWKEIYSKTITGTAEYALNYTWPNSTDSGTVVLKLTAWDKARNESSDSVRIVILNEGSQRPTANILFPANYAHLNGFATISGYATDNKFTRYSLALSGHSIDTLLVESINKKENDVLFTLNTRSFSDGKYQLTLKVFNETGNYKSDLIFITIDNTAPVAEIVLPATDTLNCMVEIHGNASDANLKSVKLEYARQGETDPGKYILIDTSFTTWKVMDLNGFFTLYLTCEDSSGLKTIDSKTFFIDNQMFKEQVGLTKRNGEFSLYIPPYGYHSSFICIEKRDDFVEDGLICACQIHSSINEKQLRKPAMLTIDFKNINCDEHKLAIYRYEAGKWNISGGTINSNLRQITTTINQIGVYALFESENLASVAHQGLEIDCQPRVFSPYGSSFNEETNISFHLVEDLDVSAFVYSLSGRLVRTLCENKPMRKGTNVLPWNGKDQHGGYCVSGMYIVMVQAA
ncbi:hypothetical protein JW964_21390, partial [candidate division KSB1 bacterium]|nr:hypothetical protein [candidate division KSB1 bacterium]